MAEDRGRAAGRLVAAALLALAGCAVGGPLPSPSAAPPALPPAEQIAGAAGAELALSAWPAVEPKAVILGVHGFGDYGPSTFARAAEFWAGHGIATYAYDQRGFGRNASFKRWPGAVVLADDLVAVARQLRARHPCLPLVVVGHSMGGGVVLAAAAEGLDADALVLAAPAIWGGAALDPMQRLGAWALAAVAPDHRFTGKGVVRIQASDNIEVLRALGRDPHHLHPPSAREIMGLVRVTDRAAQAAAQVDTPALLLLGAKDQIAPEAPVKAVFARLTGPTRVIEYPEGWHLLFRDLQAATVWRDVADWALAAPGPACAAPAG